MLRLRLTALALYRVLRLRIMNPRNSRCMMVSLALVLVTAAPIARLNRTMDEIKPLAHISILAKQVLGMEVRSSGDRQR